MLTRLLTLPKKRSFFLFGARNTGKTTLIEKCFPKNENLWINLLDPAMERRFALKPEELVDVVSALPDSIEHVVIDEI